MISSEELSKLTAKAAKKEAFQMGKANTSWEDFETWMKDKWGQPHAAKLQALYYDAIANTQILADYNAVCQRFLNLNLGNFQSCKLGLSEQRKVRLCSLVDALDIALPGKVDFQPTILIKLQPNSEEAGGKNRKELFKSQIKASVALLKAATALLNYLCDLSDLARQNMRSEEGMDFRFLLTTEFYKTASGLPGGICHVQVHKALSAKSTQFFVRMG
ncbi:hypothetical protein [Pseudoduganella aquatica]|uniref:Uncharacterized protein n=1 Tax=Pseudoduganella aquatica TaxID=2660641 RepID=A0A7X4H752_9BURK|nr:hypothetical protein [Pseudoduganella aquatica]MYN05954.1 hypothetical protein [Pseudoduganella aquatica]